MIMDENERLTAWLDGALPPAEAEAFAAELARNPDLAAQARAWQANDQRITAAFAAAERPIDAAMLERLGLAPTRQVANDNAPWFGRRALAGGSALAAGIAAAVMVALQPASPPDALSGALERTATLAPARLADGRTVTPMLTVRAADGRWCREYRAGDETALACRTAGRWSIEAHAHAGKAADPGAIAMASGADTAPLDGAYRRLGASDPLSAAEESKLLADGWK